MADGLIRGAIPGNAVHLCIDMQRMFAEDTPWRTPWMERVLPVVVGLCEHKSDRTWFTRFIPAATVGEGWGTWMIRTEYVWFVDVYTLVLCVVVVS